MQVKTSVLKSGKKIESDIVIVGVGAKPNTEMFKGQIDLLEDKPGGIKVIYLRLVKPHVPDLLESQAASGLLHLLPKPADKLIDAHHSWKSLP